MEAIKIFVERHDLKIESVVYSFAGLGNCINELRELGINKIRLFCPRSREKIIADNLIFNINAVCQQPIVPSSIKPGQAFKKQTFADIETFPYALGETEAKIVMYLSANDNGDGNSLLKWYKHLQLYPAIKPSGTDKVNTQRLDKIFECEPFSLLYLNQNGYEVQALRGASDILPCYDFIIVPLFRGELYENTPKICEIADYLDQTYEMVDFCQVHRDRKIDKFRSFALFARCGMVKSYDKATMETIIDWSRANRPFMDNVQKPDFDKEFVRIEFKSNATQMKSQYLVQSKTKKQETIKPTGNEKESAISISEIKPLQITEKQPPDDEIDQSRIIHPFTTESPFEFRPQSKINSFPCYFLERFINTKFSSYPVKRKFLPIFWNDFYLASAKGQNEKIISRLISYIKNLPRNIRYFTINDCPVNFVSESAFEGLDILVFSPYSKNPETWMPELFPKVEHPAMNRDLFASFCGNTSENEIITEMIAQFNTDKEIETVIADVDIVKSQNLIVSTMRRSIFALCPESENTYATFRISAALQYGTIPVILCRNKQDNHLKGYLTYDFEEIRQVIDSLKSIPIGKIHQLIKEGQEAYNSHYSYSAWFKKIVKQLQEEDGSIYLKKVPRPVIAPIDDETGQPANDESPDEHESDCETMVDNSEGMTETYTDSNNTQFTKPDNTGIPRFDWNG